MEFHETVRTFHNLGFFISCGICNSQDNYSYYKIQNYKDPEHYNSTDNTYLSGVQSYFDLDSLIKGKYHINFGLFHTLLSDKYYECNISGNCSMGICQTPEVLRKTISYLRLKSFSNSPNIELRCLWTTKNF